MSFNDVVVVGPLAVDMSQNSITFKDKSAYLGPLRTHLLGYLCKHVNQVVGRDDLSDAVWGRSVSDHTINQHISQLRKVITTLNNTDLTIATIPKKGYIARCESVGQPNRTKAEPAQVQAKALLLSDPATCQQIQSHMEDGELKHLEMFSNAGLLHDRLMTNEFQVVIVDTDLANAEGLKLIKAIRTGQTLASSDIAILSMASEASKQLLGFNVLMDVQGLVVKPVNNEVLEKQIKSALAARFKLKPNVAYDLVPTMLNTSVNVNLQSTCMSN
ncbi:MULTISPECIES: winged helix-turn-helix domain-containing protein [unclassified Agarivorans]|uniref:winged helix-turn-helix domain-containing protein n=1 Tax=unclassified Agarivorans TaxID=2636026 RepID=UPI0026E15346|nr:MULTISPECIES: winged helix-turn-helix domain-containing protein [unclassified Agarivorans]MDO6686937.1 winged helix-turn-helix domain-containing protein [Agarivorans sp. 3_MG-2023]MDO6716734.1 winged helix-turn-helix domain-containing protein [Agarivorans sp. 2_MG-2023]MDO6764527.1 winged helix-turn-helix domain-containing protein [Agarivorans sp. 1_MG-2023]